MQRDPRNPILTRSDIPAISPLLTDVSSVFNPGAVRWQGKEMLLLRVQTRGRETVTICAEGDGGGNFEVRPSVIEIEGLQDVGETIYHVYDPRLTVLEGAVHIVFAADVDGACRLGIARTTDFERFELVSFDTSCDTRNGVLFPEKIDGRYLRLHRPNEQSLAGGPATGCRIMLSESDDLVTWRDIAPIATGRPHYWDELIGAGPPPIKTKRGWLQVYHGVATHFQSANIYQAGVLLLDLEVPAKVLGRSRNNILEPRELYELTGQVPNVVFPSGLIAEDVDSAGFAALDSQVRLYYGAADTVVGLAHASISELLNACAESD
jgi:beta-1,4-mannooligosaccharide/beta-1,4-mannosyl-N-acetylglucosamine phosphorylase